MKSNEEIIYCGVGGLDHYYNNSAFGELVLENRDRVYFFDNFDITQDDTKKMGKKKKMKSNEEIVVCGLYHYYSAAPLSSYPPINCLSFHYLFLLALSEVHPE